MGCFVGDREVTASMLSPQDIGYRRQSASFKHRAWTVRRGYEKIQAGRAALSTKRLLNSRPFSGPKLLLQTNPSISMSDNPLPRPAYLPSLPDRASGNPWSDLIHQAYGVITEAYNQSKQLLRLEDGDPIRLRLHSERLSIRIWSVLQQLAGEIQDDGWRQECEAALAALIDELDQAAQSVDTM